MQADFRQAREEEGKSGKNDRQISSCCHNCGHMDRQMHAFLLCMHWALSAFFSHDEGKSHRPSNCRRNE